MPAERVSAESHPEVTRIVGGISDLCHEQPFPVAADALMTCFSDFVAQVLVQTEGTLGVADEARISRFIDEYADMLKQTVLIDVLNLKGERRQ